MPEYTVFYFRRDGSNSKTAIYAIDDAEAIGRTRKIDQMLTAEVWQGRRLVSRVGEPAPSPLETLLPPPHPPGSAMREL